MIVKEILKEKGPQVFTIGEENKLSEAIQILVNNNIGSLIVLDETGKIKGIITERDILRMNHKNPEDFGNMSVSEIMTKDIIIAEPEDNIEYIESIMTKNRIRHLPIVRDKVLVGIISIGDIVKSLIKEIRSENKYLYDYISGNMG